MNDSFAQNIASSIAQIVNEQRKQSTALNQIAEMLTRLVEDRPKPK